MTIFRTTLAISLLVAIWAAVLGSRVPAKSSQGNSKSAQDANLSGLHDFDSLAGQWKTHHRRLKERLTGSHVWVEFDGSMSARLLMAGFVNARDSVYEAPGSTYRGVGLSAYDSKTGQWATWGLDSRNPSGALDPPLKGHFENEVGTFYSDESFQGKPIRVRVTWSHITSTSARWEQALSPDDGGTWETNWTTDYERVPALDSRDTPDPIRGAYIAGLHDFDFLIGKWQAHHRLLKERLADSHEWIEYGGTLNTRQLMDGWANMGDNVLVRLRVTWSQITPTSARWEQALSGDGGKTWETNWITDFQRVS